MKCSVCGGQGVQLIHTTLRQPSMFTEWRYYCDQCITLALIVGQLKTNPMTHRKQWYEEVQNGK